jgi:hypothetical protein
MSPVLRQELFDSLPVGQRPIRDAASGAIAYVSQDRHLNYRGTTNSTAALGAWEDTFGSVTKGVSDLVGSIGSLITGIKGTKGSVNPYGGGYPVNTMYGGQQPYYGVNPTIPAYGYPSAPVQTQSSNLPLYTGLAIAAVAGFIFLKNK